MDLHRGQVEASLFLQQCSCNSSRCRHAFRRSTFRLEEAGLGLECSSYENCGYGRGAPKTISVFPEPKREESRPSHSLHLFPDRRFHRDALFQILSSRVQRLLARVSHLFSGRVGATRRDSTIASEMRSAKPSWSTEGRLMATNTCETPDSRSVSEDSWCVAQPPDSIAAIMSSTNESPDPFQ